ncbi:copper resistance CopC/CopD family protein [Nocardioides montaniterrae]
MSRSRVLRRACLGAVVVAACVLGVLLGSSPASAHAMVVSSTPAPGSLLRTAPSSVAITFDEAVTTVPDSLRVYGPDGERVDHGALVRPGGRGNTIDVAIGSGAKGTYLVSWRVVSADSHPISGAFTFSVGRRSMAPSAPQVTSDTGLGTLLGVARGIGYAGSALLLGGSLLLALARTGAAGTARGRRRLLGGGVACLVGSAVVALGVQGAYDAGLGWSAIGRPSLVGAVLSTTFGHGLLLRIAAALVFAAALVLVGGRARVALAALAGLVLVVSFAMTGHGVAGPLEFVSTSIHVAVASIWIGGLAVLALLVLPGKGDPRELVTRFSTIALACVVALVVTGTYQAWKQVGARAALTATTYGRELLVKLALVVLTLVAAAFSRRWVRRARHGDAGPLRAVERELVLGMAIIGVTTVIATTMPAAVAYHPSTTARLTTGTDVVEVSAVPTGDRMLDLDLRLLDADRRPTDPPEVDVTVSLPGRSLGPLPVSMHRVARGHLVGSVAVPVVGTWTLAVDVRTSAIDEHTATTDLPIR